MSLTRTLNSTSDTSTSYLVVELLKTLKDTHDYKSLSKLTGIPISTMTRYVNGKTLPRGRKTVELMTKLISIVDVEKIVRERITNGPDGVDITPAVSEGHILKLITAHFIKNLTATQVSSILAVDEPGIVLATSIGLVLGRRVYFVSERPLWPEESAINIKYYIKESGERRNVWVPKGAIKSRKSTLVVAGMLSHPALFRELYKRATENGGHLAGLCTIVSSASALQELKPHQIGEKHVLITI
ncbi:MAG: hypothetical protein QW756_07940 [Nitrososphaerota archaeon]